MAERRFRDESYLCEITAKRKGRGQEPCTFKIGHIHHRHVVVRANDRDGIPSIVALMDAATAREFARNLQESADALLEGVGASPQ